MALPYLDLPAFRARTMLAVGDVDYVEGFNPGYTAARIAIRTSWIHARLTKRYGKSLPFGAPFPEAVLGWLTAMVSYDVLRKRGFNPQDPTAMPVVDDATKAEAEVKEASDGETGLFDLPSPEGGASNVTTGGPLGYSETSPYVSMSKQRNQGVIEDFNGDGTGDD